MSIFPDVLSKCASNVFFTHRCWLIPVAAAAVQLLLLLLMVMTLAVWIGLRFELLVSIGGGGWGGIGVGQLLVGCGQFNYSFWKTIFPNQHSPNSYYQASVVPHTSFCAVASAVAAGFACQTGDRMLCPFLFNAEKRLTRILVGGIEDQLEDWRIVADGEKAFI